VDIEDARTIGARLRRIRKSRDKSLQVVADLTGGVVSASTLSRIENGLRVLDRRSEIVAIANVLQIAPSELTRQPEPAPVNGDADSAVVAVRQALTAVSRNRPGGRVLPVDVLQIQVSDVLDAGRLCRQAKLGTVLPVLIRDLHTSIAAGQDVAELLELAVMLHTQGTHAWLRVMSARVEVRSLATLVARQAAEHRDQSTTLGLAVWGDGLAMLASGDFDLARAELDAVTVPTNTPESMQLEGMLALCRSLVAAADKRPASWPSAQGRVTPTGWGSVRRMWRCGAWLRRWKPGTTSAPSPSQNV
jgi:transcriptional regulator with XRE-family HTH domain